jgi:hypothetical protein
VFHAVEVEFFSQLQIEQSLHCLSAFARMRSDSRASGKIMQHQMREALSRYRPGSTGFDGQRSSCLMYIVFRTVFLMCKGTV